MTALLEHQRIGRRPQGLVPVRPYGHSWRDAMRPIARPRVLPAPETRRGSERLDELIRHQAPARPARRPVHRPARPPRRVAHARIRVERRGTLSMSLSALWSEARSYAADNWRVLCYVAGGAVGILFCLIVFSLVPGVQRAPGISLASSASLDNLLLEGRLPDQSATAGSLGPGVVSILRVRQHEVKAGETLSEVAGRYGLRLGTVINFNAITDARSIPVGMKLSIPNADGLLYRVSRGDSLARIAKAYGVSANALMDWNDLQSEVIKPGDKLFVPGASLSEDAINAVLGKLFVYPTRGELTSYFGMRVSPFYKTEIFHNGIDLHNRTGTPVYASRAGRVSGVEVNPTYGKVVMVAHSGGYQTMYAHLDTILVRRGQNVAQGEQLGTMGSTGATTGPHLHFSVFKNSEPVDPLRLLH